MQTLTLHLHVLYDMLTESSIKLQKCFKLNRFVLRHKTRTMVMLRTFWRLTGRIVRTIRQKIVTSSVNRSYRSGDPHRVTAVVSYVRPAFVNSHPASRGLLPIIQ